MKSQLLLLLPCLFAALTAATQPCSVSANVVAGSQVCDDNGTPNDNSDDTFTRFTDPGEVVRIRRLTIFDRWGNQVFEQKNLPPNVGEEGWDGRFRGEPMNSAVFVFYAEVEFADGEVEVFKGEVLLLR